MSDSLHHDPRTKQQLKDTIHEFLYAPVERHFKARIETIIDQNCLLGRFSHRSFSYKGHLFNVDSSPVPFGKRNPLVAHLRPMVDQYLLDRKKLNEEELPLVLGFINTALNSSNSFSDYLRLLPEAVHKPIQELAQTCPYCTAKLSEARIEDITKRSQLSISMIKERVIRNLLI